MPDNAALQMRLQKIKDQLCGGNAAELARRIKKDSTYVNRLFYPAGKRGAKGIGLEIMSVCNEAFALPPGYWEGAATDWELTTSTVAEVVIPECSVDLSTGAGRLILEDRRPGLIKNWRVDKDWIAANVRNHTGAHNLCILTAFGQSMQPTYNPGDPLLVDRGVRSVDTDGIYFFRVAQHGFVKQLQRIPTEQGVVLRAKSLNPAYDPFDITKKMDFEVYGRVIKAWKSEQT